MGKSGLAMALLGLLALPRDWRCFAPSSSTCRTHSRYSRDLDLSSASAKLLGSEEDGVDQRLGAAQGASKLPTFPALVGQHTASQGRESGAAGSGGAFALLRCGCDVGRSPAKRGSRRLRMFICSDCASAEIVDPPCEGAGLWG